jgi:hypothetical protein
MKLVSLNGGQFIFKARRVNQQWCRRDDIRGAAGVLGGLQVGRDKRLSEEHNYNLHDYGPSSGLQETDLAQKAYIHKTHLDKLTIATMTHPPLHTPHFPRPTGSVRPPCAHGQITRQLRRPVPLRKNSFPAKALYLSVRRGGRQWLHVSRA